ncbi:hypothetical protein PR048_032717 [Dryococelus australis]|uniref:Uncharacterized protein n=1 Tax=Dryococelus australis TaxID=614101 RepID=A0ABQ9G2Y8_9NEOP|nr:hypothetical protein PR048_032717 [Dryococelus australis]
MSFSIAVAMPPYGRTEAAHEGCNQRGPDAASSQGPAEVVLVGTCRKSSVGDMGGGGGWLESSGGRQVVNGRYSCPTPGWGARRVRTQVWTGPVGARAGSLCGRGAGTPVCAAVSTNHSAAALVTKFADARRECKFEVCGLRPPAVLAWGRRKTTGSFDCLWRRTSSHNYSILMDFNRIPVILRFNHNTRLPPGRTGFDSHVGTVPYEAAGLWVYSGIPLFPRLPFRRCSVLTSISLTVSQDLDVKSRPNLFTHSLHTTNYENVHENGQQMAESSIEPSMQTYVQGIFYHELAKFPGLYIKTPPRGLRVNNEKTTAMQSRLERVPGAARNQGAGDVLSRVQTIADNWLRPYGRNGAAVRCLYARLFCGSRYRAISAQGVALLRRKTGPRDVMSGAQPTAGGVVVSASNSRLKSGIERARSCTSSVIVSCFAGVEGIKNRHTRADVGARRQPPPVLVVAPTTTNSRRVAVGGHRHRKLFRTVRVVQNWTGDRDEVHLEPPELAVPKLVPRSAAIVDKSLRVAAVAERLASSPPTMANRVQSQGRIAPGFSHVGIVPDDATGRRCFLGDLPFPHALSFRCCSILTSMTLIGSQGAKLLTGPRHRTLLLTQDTQPVQSIALRGDVALDPRNSLTLNLSRAFRPRTRKIALLQSTEHCLVHCLSLAAANPHTQVISVQDGSHFGSNGATLPRHGEIAARKLPCVSGTNGGDLPRHGAASQQHEEGLGRPLTWICPRPPAKNITDLPKTWLSLPDGVAKAKYDYFH